MSNKYPVWWDKTITIFNKIVASDGKVSWQSTVIENCFWKYINSTKYVDNVKMQTKEVICRIPEQDNYVPYLTWKDLADKTGSFTLRNGDFVVYGEVTDTIDEYTKGQRATDVLNKYREVNLAFQIDVFTDNTGDVLCAEHYRLGGI